ncbi:MAG: sugar ABC transporter ATP-binding protein [Silicimonas sp.]|jgi:ribose transport system ATP-binding protein|uniref:sugar ABC transporter ATP-binding protein n=1 Tax=Roseitalea porphyridii TaxID=1852022 RepID=UPI0032ED329C
MATVETKDLSKTYGAVKALDGVSHIFEAGRIHALMGKNGSGKSTLVKMLSGVVQPTRGEIRLNGETVSFRGPADAFAKGVVTVHQELSLVAELSVAENVFLGRLPMQRTAGITRIDWTRVYGQTRTLLDTMAVDIDPHTPVGRLSVGQQQIVEIAKAMSFDPALLLLDEPTSALASKEVEMLFDLLRVLRARGVTMMYISHRMSELGEIADTVTVLRDGKLVGAVEFDASSNEEIIDMMFGSVARAHRPARATRAKTAADVLKVRGLTREPAFRDISFDLAAGEVLGIAGMLGAGRTELLRAIFGAEPPDSGEIIVDGATVHRPAPRRMTNLGIGYTPENRKEAGLIHPHSIHANLSLASLPQIAPRGLVTRAAETPGVARQVEHLEIKVGSVDDPVSSLSGGNQQKVVIGNWLNTNPKILFYDEPSRGVDVGAKQQIFRIIWEEADRGVGAIFVSTELEEVLEVCDRILVMREGNLVGELDPTNTTLTELYTACMGES